jgi:hypothetical protein
LTKRRPPFVTGESAAGAVAKLQGMERSYAQSIEELEKSATNGTVAFLPYARPRVYARYERHYLLHREDPAVLQVLEGHPGARLPLYADGHGTGTLQSLDMTLEDETPY